MICYGCKTDISRNEFLKCNNCSSTYCYLCLNVTVESVKQLSAEKLASLSCPFCLNVTKRKAIDKTTDKSQDISFDKTLDMSFSQISPSTSTQIAMCPPAGACPSGEAVTMESISRLFDQKLSPDSSFMINLRSALREDVKEMVTAEVNRAIGEAKLDFTATTDFICAEQMEMRSEIADKGNRIVELESKLTKSHLALSKLQSRLTTVEKISRDMNIELHEVPENKSEDLTALFKKLCECLQVVITNDDIKACRRVSKMNTDSKRPRNILVSLSSQRLRDSLLSAVTRFNKAHSGDRLSLAHIDFAGASSRIYLSEHLSPEVKVLHSQARNFCKDKNFKFVWVRFGQIYVRKDEKSPAVLIRNCETLNKLGHE